jgi:3-hydroxymyristoyl/3-hydroxydecanoyl-(acyl carrier protein) dehydratase
MQLYTFKGIETDAPFLQGHFPGNPIVPGAILLGCSAQALMKLGYEIILIQRLKFIRPLIPDQPFEIRFEKGEVTSKLSWHSLGNVLANARVELRGIDG